MNHFYATALKCVGACAFADSFKVIYSVVGYLENFMIFIKYLGFFSCSLERASNLILCELFSTSVSFLNNVFVSVCQY